MRDRFALTCAGATPFAVPFLVPSLCTAAQAGDARVVAARGDGPLVGSPRLSRQARRRTTRGLLALGLALLGGSATTAAAQPAGERLAIVNGHSGHVVHDGRCDDPFCLGHDVVGSATVSEAALYPDALFIAGEAAGAGDPEPTLE